jgi:general secretion pathway protein D
MALRRYSWVAAALGVALISLARPLGAVQQEEGAIPVVQGDSVMIQLVDVDLRAAIQALGRHLERPVIFGSVPGGRVTLETPAPVPRSEVLALLRGVLESHNLELLEEGGSYRVRPREQGRPGGGAERVPRPAGALELFTIRLSHARAADVAATVNALYGRASALGELGARPPVLADELRQNQMPPLRPGELGAVVGAGRAAALSGEVVIVPDPRSNSLLIRASQLDFELIQAAVKELDVRPLQVLIEVLIAEVRRDRGYDMGWDFTLPKTAVPGRHNAEVEGSTSTGLGLGDLVIHVMNIGRHDIEGILRAGASKGNVAIVSRPVVLAANNESARIMVGSQRPFVQVSRSLPTDAPTRDQVVQYKDVGTQLTVIPTISADGYVMLGVTQEVNAATTETAFNAPIISSRAVQTQLLIKDGQTIILGGLTDRQRDHSRSGVPVLSRFPIIGALFGRTSRRTTETELFLFLTPRVIRTDEEAEGITGPLKERAERIK